MTTTAVNTFDITKNKAKFGTLHADNLLVGGGWKTYSPTYTNFTLHASDTALWTYSIVGTTIFLKGVISHGTSVGTSTTGAYSFSLPTGCVLKDQGLSWAGGSAWIANSTAPYQTVGTVYNATSTTIRVYITTGAGTAAAWGHTTDAAIRFSINQALNVTLNFIGELDPTCAVCAKLTA